MKKFLNTILIASLFFFIVSCKPNTSKINQKAQYLVLKDDGVPTHSALKGRGSKNYSEILDENGNLIGREKIVLNEPFLNVVVGDEYAYSVNGSSVKINLKNGKFEYVNEFLKDKFIEDIQIYKNDVYFSTNEGVNTSEEKNSDNWYKSHIVKENGKIINCGLAIYKINFIDDTGYATALGPNYSKLLEFDTELSHTEEIKKGFTESPSINRFTFNNKMYSTGLLENQNHIVRFSDDKIFSLKLYSIESKNIDLDNNFSIYFNEFEKNLYLSLSENEKTDTSEKIRGIYKIEIDEINSEFIGKQIINEDIFAPSFYNGCVSIPLTNETKLYDLNTGKEIFNIKEENVKAILKLKN